MARWTLDAAPEYSHEQRRKPATGRSGGRIIVDDVFTALDGNTPD
jgi:hypothetical protein